MVSRIKCRQFKLKHLFWISLTLCVPLGLISPFPDLGYPLSLGVFSFWIGMGCLFISDSNENRSIDDRGFVSQLFNILGLFVITLSLIGTTLFSLACVVWLVLSSR